MIKNKNNVHSINLKQFDYILYLKYFHIKYK